MAVSLTKIKPGPQRLMKLAAFCSFPQTYARTNVVTSKSSFLNLGSLHMLHGTNFETHRLLSTQTESKVDESAKKIMTDQEKPTGEKKVLEFQAETRMLLDIVAKSLYSDKEVFIRELISNASDALEKLRYVSLNDAENQDIGVMEIHLSTDKQNQILIIQDSGIGMTKEELINNLGTIARSGSKAFLQELKGKSNDVSNIIGQFGVGFYSCFMVADKVEVFTKSFSPDSPGYCWTSDGSGTYEIQEAEGVRRGTKIVIHLKTDCREFSDEETVSSVIKKYSNFVNSPIYVNGKQANTIQPIWIMDPKEVTADQHMQFYKFISNSYDKPRFTLHYKTDAPLTIRALLYFPEGKPGLFEMSREAEAGVALYTRRVLIKSNAENILPKWLRFMKGVVDSEDIPLNISRELLQNSPLISKLRNVLTNRILKFLHDKSVKDTSEYDLFYKDYNVFLKEGIVTNYNQIEKEEIAKLLRFESSTSLPGETVSLQDYCGRLKEGQKEIFYLSAPSRTLAESSPYYEALRKKDVEVLFCYEPHDEVVLMQLRTFKDKEVTSVEKEVRQDKDSDDLFDLGTDSLRKTELDELLPWIEKTLKNKAYSIKVTKKLDNHPCVVTVEEMAAARHFIKTKAHELSEDMRYSLLQPRFEINPRHPIIRKLHGLTSTNPELAELITAQLFSNAMVAAGLIEDPRTILSNMNQLLTLALEKH